MQPLIPAAPIAPARTTAWPTAQAQASLHAESAHLRAAYLAKLTHCTCETPAGKLAILIPTEGSAIDAEWNARRGGARREHIEAPSVGVLRSGAPQKLSCALPSDVLVLDLDAEFFTEVARRELGAEPVAPSYNAPDPFLRGVGNALMAGFRNEREPGADYLDSLAVSIATHLAHRCRVVARPGASGGLPTHKVEKVRTLVMQRLGSPIHVGDLAEAVCLSPFHFARMFKLATGESPHAFITRARMEEAQRLLTQSDMPLAQVATVVGYRTQAHFTGVFHEHVGTTPRAFRVRSRSAV